MKRLLPALILVIIAGFVALKIFPRISMTRVTVITIPRGADIFINGLPVGKAPTARLVPGEGVHIAASRDGFFPADTLLQSIPDTVLLQLTQGALLIVNSIPAGCSIQTGNFVGDAPCSLVVFPGNPIEVTALGEMGIEVARTVNILSPGIRVLTITVPWQFTDSTTGIDFVAIPRELMPFAMGPMTASRDEVTAAVFTEFMNSMDPALIRDSFSLRGRTLLMDSIMKSNWDGPVSFNGDTTAYAPVQGFEEHPVTGVTQQGAELFCEWLTDQSSTGLVFRLPDRDEWVCLAAPGEDLPYNHSDRSEIILTRNQTVDDGWSRTAPSGALGYSDWGLGHMQGNVWEWISETGKAAGGSWISSTADCTAEAVIDLDPQLGYPFTGFRVVATGTPENIIDCDPVQTEGVE